MSELSVDLTLALGPRTVRAQFATGGASVCVLGPSGSGKSTLLRAIAGLDRRAQGTLTFGHEPWQTAAGVSVPSWERHVGWVPQDGLLFPHLDVAGNLAFAARADIAPIAELVRVSHLLDRRPRHLSGGERIRVALGRALARRPKLLLLDEPFAALDGALTTSIVAALAEYVRAERIPVVVATHDAASVAPLASVTLEFVGDRLVQRG